MGFSHRKWLKILNDLTKTVTTISIREDLKRLVEKALKKGHFPAGVNNFSAVLEHLIDKELKEPYSGHYPATKAVSLESISDLIAAKMSNCPTCQGKLGEIEFYEHDGGVNVKDFLKRQWVYFTCKKCGYQWALWKLLQRIKKLKEAS